MNPDFWRGKKIGICGGASFIASHAIPELVRLGVDSVWVYDDLSSGNEKNVMEHERVVFLDKFQQVDLRDYDNAIRATENLEIIFDFASVHGGRGYVGTNHEVAISDNFIINTNVLKAAVENGVERIGFSSSACVYDTRRQMDETEELYIPEAWQSPSASMHPDGMYGLTKLAHEHTLKAYHDDGLIKTAVCRFFTVFGERMKENHFILASIAKSFIKQDPFYVWGTGNEVRNFTPVQNTVEGFLLAVEQANGEAYNIGLERRITINDALSAIWDVMEWRPREIVYLPDKPVGIRNRVADCTKAKTELGWTPKVSFEEGLRDTIAWYTSTHDVETVKAELDRKLTER